MFCQDNRLSRPLDQWKPSRISVSPVDSANLLLAHEFFGSLPPKFDAFRTEIEAVEYGDLVIAD